MQKALIVPRPDTTVMRWMAPACRDIALSNGKARHIKTADRAVIRPARRYAVEAAESVLRAANERAAIGIARNAGVEHTA
jgi:hypothetical protein